jgi:riboflavin kinase/FMN adenylyltransferase
MKTLPFEISGKVIDGSKVGRTIGFPTANLDVLVTENELETGAYVGKCVLQGQEYDCLPYFGPRLVMGETKNIFEVYIYDFDQEIYGQTLSVTVLKKLHSPLPFSTLEALQQKLEEDKVIGKKILADQVIK